LRLKRKNKNPMKRNFFIKTARSIFVPLGDAKRLQGLQKTNKDLNLFFQHPNLLFVPISLC
jgi:hypothetical protein